MKKDERRQQRKQRIALTIIGTITALAAIYFGFALYFNSHYLWNTKIGVIECGGETPEYAIEQNKEIVEGYILSIYDRAGNSFAFLGTDVDYEYVPFGEEEVILQQQNPFAWIKSIFVSQEYELPTSIQYDKEKTRAVLQTIRLFEEDYYQCPVDAQIVLGDTGYEIIPEDLGNEPIYEAVLAEVMQAMDMSAETVELSDACYVKPTLLATDALIVDTAESIDTFTRGSITYEVAGDKITLTSEDFYKFLNLSDEYEIYFDEEAIKEFVQSLCYRYNTFGDVRNFTTHAGDVIQIGGGDYGWVVSKQNELEQIKADIMSGEDVTREPVYEQTAVSHSEKDYGNTYIEIDYNAQHMWYYKDGVVVLESDIVSGNLSHQNGSVDGVYSVSYKQKDAQLVGEDYSSSVKYFMPFAYNIGFHDASWRSSFGGDIYLTGGSHGCINLPPSFAEALFKEVAIDTPVIAYYRTPVVLTNNAARVSNAYSYQEPEEEEQEGQ